MDSKEKKYEIKKVVAIVSEQLEPVYYATVKCPYCKVGEYWPDIEYENTTILHTCCECDKTYKIKIPKYL